MSQAPWLFNYGNREFVNSFLYVADYPNLLDRKERFFLKQKKSAQTASVEELKRLEELKNIVHKILEMQDKKQPLPSENMPHTVYALPPLKVPKPQEKILTNGSIFLYESIATVLMQFNLGQTKLSKVDIINILTDEKVTDDVYYYVNLAEKRDYFLAEQSEQVRGNRYNSSIKCKYIRGPQKGDIALKADAVNCDVDLWHEPLLYDSWFMSDRLVQALIKAGLTPQQDIDLVQCRLV